MKYCVLSELQPGMILGRPVHGSKGRILLASGKELDRGFIDRLRELDFPGAYIDLPGFESVDPPEIVDAVLRAETETLIDECFDTLIEFGSTIQEFDGSIEDSLNAHPELKNTLQLQKFQHKVANVVEELTSQYATELPCLLLKTQSKYQVQHAMDTMLLSVLLGINFRFIYRELKQLGLAAMLHDVGKTLLTEPGEKNVSPDHPYYEDHPAIGSLIVLESGSNHYNESAAIMQHHERQDGKGFPEGLIGYNKAPGPGSTYQSGTIYRLAEIISVADAYDVLTSGIFKPALTPEEAIQNLINRSTFEFNHHVVSMLAKVVQILPVGCNVKIVKCSNPAMINCHGVVQKTNSDMPYQADIVLTRDNRGNALPPSLISLAEDKTARLELVFN